MGSPAYSEFPESITDETNQPTPFLDAMEETLKRKKIIYIDLDGVVADLEQAVKEYCPHLDTLEGDERTTAFDSICNLYGLFASLPPIEGAIDAVTQLLTNSRFEVYFLSTAMWDVPQSWTDKRIWVEKYFGDLAKKRLILTHRKDLCIGDFLVDDRFKNGAGEFRGEHIHFGSEKFPNWKSVLEYLLGK